MTEQAASTNLGTTCGACGCHADEWIGLIPFYLPDHDIDTQLWRCLGCGTYSRHIDLDDPALRRHFDVASYTSAEREARFRSVRTGYFVYIAELLEQSLDRPLKGARILDVGTAYGHFLELLNERGAIPEGVEIVAALRARGAERGLVVHDRIPDSPHQKYDAVTVIDSLYYTNDPLATLQRIRGVLAPRGSILIRVTNRIWLLDLLHTLGVAINRDRFGDAKYNFSPGGMLQLLDRAGFRVEYMIWEERGKADPRWMIRWYYKISELLCRYLSLRVTPGMLIVARGST
jgi:SAM-dependent methyltransferase